MDSYREGLNYVPMLTQNTTPPCSGRSRINLSRKRSRNSLLHYNGNYEGDNSMFRDKGLDLERLNLVDTESDTEFQGDITTIYSARTNENYRKTSLFWSLVEFFMLNFLKPELREKISTRIEIFKESNIYKWLSKWAAKISILFTYIFFLIAIICKHLSELGHIFWRQRVIFYNLARRILWRLTLAKCNDLSLFALILLSIPVLFILSSIGFLISICGCLKDALDRGINILNKIK